MLNYIKIADQKILHYLNEMVKNWGFWNKLFAEYLIYLMPLALLWLWFYDIKTKKVALRAFVSIILAWPVLAYITGQLVHRVRPFELGGIRELLFHRPTYSFPSDHAAAFFAFAASLYFSGEKKLGIIFFGVAIIMSVFRVATGLHWPSDIVAGLVIGVVAAYLVDLFDKPLNLVYELILKIAKIVRLA